MKSLSQDIPLVLGDAHDETRTLIGRNRPECFDLPWDGLAQRIAKELEGRTDIDADLVLLEYRRLYTGPRRRRRPSTSSHHPSSCTGPRLD